MTAPQAKTGVEVERLQIPSDAEVTEWQRLAIIGYNAHRMSVVECARGPEWADAGITTQLQWISAAEEIHKAVLAAERAEAVRVREENEKLRTDAERYRWLRKSHPDDEVGIFVSRERLNGWGRTVAKIFRNTELDQAIDKARAALSPSQQGEPS